MLIWRRYDVVSAGALQSLSQCVVRRNNLRCATAYSSHTYAYDPLCARDKKAGLEYIRQVVDVQGLCLTRDRTEKLAAVDF